MKKIYTKASTLHWKDYLNPWSIFAIAIAIYLPFYSVNIIVSDYYGNVPPLGLFIIIAEIIIIVILFYVWIYFSIIFFPWVSDFIRDKTKGFIGEVGISIRLTLKSGKNLIKNLFKWLVRIETFMGPGVIEVETIAVRYNFIDRAITGKNWNVQQRETLSSMLFSIIRSMIMIIIAMLIMMIPILWYIVQIFYIAPFIFATSFLTGWFIVKNSSYNGKIYTKKSIQK